MSRWILQTAVADQERVGKVRALAVHDYDLKPFRRETLVRSVDQSGARLEPLYMDEEEMEESLNGRHRTLSENAWAWVSNRRSNKCRYLH